MAADNTSTTDAKDEQGQKDQQDAGQTTSDATGAKDDIDQIVAQADKPDAVRNALNAERAKASAATKEAERLAAEVKKYQDRDKSEQEKLEERATAAERKAEQAERNLLRVRVAAAKSLPAELADRLQGKDQKELEADADRLLELVKPKGSGDADAGKGQVSAGETFNDRLRAAARR